MRLITLSPGASCSVTLSFTPTALGVRAGALTITNADADSTTTVPLNGTGVPNGTFTLTVNGKALSTATVKSGDSATYPLTVTPQSNFSGTIILNCTPVTPGQYAACSLQPSSIAISGAAQNSVATLNTVTSDTVTLARASRRPDSIFLCLLPAALLFFWRTRPTRVKLLVLFLAAATLLPLTGCGSGGSLEATNPSLQKTPPGTYQYQVTATSTTGPRITQTVTLNLTVQ